MARYNYLDFNVALDLIKYLRQETELIPLTAGFKSIQFLLTFLDQQDFFVDFRDILLSIVDEVYVRINNSTTSEDDDYHVLTKLHVNLFACKLGARSCLNDATRKLSLFDFESGELDVDERPHLYCGILGADSISHYWEQLKTKLLKVNENEELYRDNQEEVNEIFEAFSACDPDINRVERFLNDVFVLSTYVSLNKENALQIIQNLIKTSSAHRSLMMQFFSEHFNAVNQK